MVFLLHLQVTIVATETSLCHLIILLYKLIIRMLQLYIYPGKYDTVHKGASIQRLLLRLIIISANTMSKIQFTGMEKEKLGLAFLLIASLSQCKQRLFIHTSINLLPTLLLQVKFLHFQCFYFKR